MRVGFAALLIVVLLSSSGAVLALEKRVALVIGNANYREAPLANPVNDANDMEVALKASGFRVIKALDASQKEMNRAIARFGELLTADSVALFYYAGHGLQVRGKNYLIPVDAEIKSESMVRVESVDVDGVLDQLSLSELNVVILDACRNNPFDRKAGRALGSGGLAQMEAPKGSVIAYSTAPGKTAADGDGRNGVYTQALLRYIREPGLTIEQVFKKVRKEVSRSTRDQQMPWESSSMTGEFYFHPGNRPGVAVVQAQVERPAEKASVPPTPGPEKAALVALAKVQQPVEIPVTQSEAPVVNLIPDAAQVVEETAESKSRSISTESFTATGRLSLDRSSGAMSGEGVIEWKNGDRYDGEMRGGNKHGKGIFTWANGQRYEGEWADDVINGVGTLYYANGDRYVGSFVSGAPHGKGTYTLQNGDVYVGDWVAGSKHGQGRLTWVSGDYWEGEFSNDEQTANGRLVYGEASNAPEEPAVAEIPAAAEKPDPRKKAK
ncbi:MAG: caspase family protein [Rhodocyclaceae bacterium]|nr:caspase family protein [Rhodocyclaceae bacterium]